MGAAAPQSVLSRGDASWQEQALQLTGPTDTSGLAARNIDASALLGTLTATQPEVIDLNGGYLHAGLQPRDLFAAAPARIARRTSAWDRPAPGDVPELRDWFAADIGAGLPATTS